MTLSSANLVLNASMTLLKKRVGFLGVMQNIMLFLYKKGVNKRSARPNVK